MEYAVTEILDGSGSPSVLGRHVTTDLWNFAMPFIRYDTQDIIEKSEKPLESEIRMDSFKEIKGRNSDILITPSGKYLIVHTFTIFFEYFSEIEQFQVIQDLPDRVRVLLVANNNFTGQTGKKILSGLEDLIGNDVKINLEIVKNIPLLASGKRKFIVRNQEIKLPF
jgi:phenylacetate-CoA ligase